MSDRFRPPVDEDLVGDYRRAQDPGSDSCPAEETLAALAMGELAEDDRDRISDHAIGCRRCSRNLQILFSTREATHGASSRRRLIWTVGVAAAAALALAALLLPALRRSTALRSDAGETLRSGTTSDPARLVSPRGGATLERAPAGLSWPRVEGDTGYRVKLFDASGAVLWESASLAARTAPLPQEIRARMAGGGSFFWVLTADRPTGSERRGPYPFSIRPR